MTSRLTHIGIAVRKLEAAEGIYRDLGLAVIERDPKRMNGRHAVLSAAFFDLDQ